VRIFVASKIDQYVTNPRINGVINDFGAGVPSRFTPINVQSDFNYIKIGVKQIYQGAWNPVRGLSDIYSTNIWNAIFDPGIFKHPYNGKTFPIRTQWNVETVGLNDSIDVPNDAIIWDPQMHEWKNVPTGTMATSKVTYDLLFSKWHNGQQMDMNDILQSIYFSMEWGSVQQDNDKTFDSEYTPQATQVVQTIVGIRVLGEDTIEMYVNYWHFDSDEIADWAGVWASMPWEITSAMEKAVLDGKVSFSRSGAASKNVNWLSLIVPNDAMIIKNNLEEFKKTKFIPNALKNFQTNFDYYESRYTSSIEWIEKNNHAIISNGPFYLASYSPESRTIILNTFDDPTYPFEAGHWKQFENVKLPEIVRVEVPEFILAGDEMTVSVNSKDSSRLHYFFTNSKGMIVDSGTKLGGSTSISLSGDKTSQFELGANSLKIFAVSDFVLRPDIFTTSFLVVKNSPGQLSQDSIIQVNENVIPEFDYFGVIAIIFGAIIIGVIYVIKRKRKKLQKIIKER